MVTVYKLTILYSLLMVFFVLSSGCSASKQLSSNDDLPILSQDELIRPYMKLGRIQVTREVYGTDYLLTPDITAWGLAVVKNEARKMGADAIMSPEVSGHSTTYGIIPSTEYRATGIAIKFK